MRPGEMSVSSKAKWRLISYLNCAQATLGTVAEGLGLDCRDTFKAACPLEGGAVSMGSTCGVVSGGCLALALALAGEPESGDGEASPAVYEALRDYTSWFEREFGSTICRERCGAEVARTAGFASYLFTGKFVSRCVAHAGPAASYLVALAGRFPGAETAGEGAPAGGYCAPEVVRGIRVDTGKGSPVLETASIALDGGVGLSGGLCGALAGALLTVGSLWGIDPVAEGFTGTLAHFLRGHANMYRGRERPELWSVGGRLVRGFLREFGSLECAAITGRKFEDAGTLADYMAGSSTCEPVKGWCRRRASELITSYIP